MLNLQPPAEAGQTAAEGARKGFDAGEVIIEHVSNTSVDDPLIHLPTVFGIDMSVTKHVLMLWVVAAILFVGITWLVRRYLRQDRLDSRPARRACSEVVDRVRPRLDRAGRTSGTSGSAPGRRCC